VELFFYQPEERRETGAHKNPHGREIMMAFDTVALWWFMYRGTTIFPLVSSLLFPLNSSPQPLAQKRKLI